MSRTLGTIIVATIAVACTDGTSSSSSSSSGGGSSSSAAPSSGASSGATSLLASSAGGASSASASGGVPTCTEQPPTESLFNCEGGGGAGRNDAGVCTGQWLQSCQGDNPSSPTRGNGSISCVDDTCTCTYRTAVCTCAWDCTLADCCP